MGPGGPCGFHRNERVFDSLPEQVFGVNPQNEHLFPEQVFDLSPEHLYAPPHV